MNTTREQETSKHIREDAVVLQVKEIIRITGISLQRINTGCFKVGKRYIRTAAKGTLDFEGYDKHGRFVGLECKRPKGGRISVEQQARIDDINRKGGVAGIVRSGSEALEILKANDCV